MSFPVSDTRGNCAPPLKITSGIASSLSVVFAALGAVATALLPATPAHAVAYSNDPLNPSVVLIDGNGQFLFDGRVGGTFDFNTGVCTPLSGLNCADYITITVPQDTVITSINLDFYNSTDDRAFIALQKGKQFTSSPDFSTSTLPGALAFNHFGWRELCATSYGSLRLANSNNPTPPSSIYNCTNGSTTDPLSTPMPTNLTDLFDSVLATSPSLPATLPAGDYTFWIQQVSGDSTYTFRVSTPGPLPLLGAAAGLSWSRRLRRRVRQGQGT